jgi:N-acetylmuramoyl-L-alanine amidase
MRHFELQSEGKRGWIPWPQDLGARGWIGRLVCISAFVFAFIGLIICVISVRNTIMPKGIIIHHSVVVNTVEGKPVDIAALDEYHRERGFGAFYWGATYHIGYHYVIFPDGTVRSGRPEHLNGAHALGYNSYLGVCLIGNFSSVNRPLSELNSQDPTPAQMRSLKLLIEQLQSKYNIPLERIRRHKDVSTGTECPGDKFDLTSLLLEIKTDSAIR